MTGSAAARMAQPSRTAPALVLVGGGPRGTAVLERLVANASTGEPFALDLHLVDPFPVGGGRVWRSDQSRLLRLNTTTEDLTLFTDDTVEMDGPVSSGPTMFEWCRTQGQVLDDPELAAEAARIGPLEFPTRRLASAYFGFVRDRAVDRLPPGVRLSTHAARAIDLRRRPDGREVVVLDTGERLVADAVLLATSHVDLRPAPRHQELADFALAHGLSYLPPGYGGDLDLSTVPEGADVLVRGFGLGFIDLMVLLTEGRGGRFVEGPEGLQYLPSGAEPRLLVGSRRGVPYHCKPMYRLQGPQPDGPAFFTPTVVADLIGRGERIDFSLDVWPVIARELSRAYYRELALGHPGRITVDWPVFEDRFAQVEWNSRSYQHWIAEVVPDAADRLDLDALDRPLRGRRFADRQELAQHLRRYVRDDQTRRQDPRFSADLALFHALLGVLPVLGPALGSGLFEPADLRTAMVGRFLSFFNFFASGPPPDRLEQLLALERAGVVSFLGAELEIEADPDGPAFVARSSSVAGEVRTRALIEAVLPAFTLERADDPLLAALVERGEVTTQSSVGPSGATEDSGQLRTDAASRLVGADGMSFARRFALGMHTAVKTPAFARPSSNGPVHRQNDRVARHLLAIAREAAPAVTDRADTGRRRSVA